MNLNMDACKHRLLGENIFEKSELEALCEKENKKLGKEIDHNENGAFYDSIDSYPLYGSWTTCIIGYILWDAKEGKVWWIYSEDGPFPYGETLSDRAELLIMYATNQWNQFYNKR